MIMINYYAHSLGKFALGLLSMFIHETSLESQFHIELICDAMLHGHDSLRKMGIPDCQTQGTLEIKWLWAARARGWSHEISGSRMT